MKIYLSLLLGLIISSCSSLKHHHWVLYGGASYRKNSISTNYQINSTTYGGIAHFSKDTIIVKYPSGGGEIVPYYRTGDTLRQLSGEPYLVIDKLSKQELVLWDYTGGHKDKWYLYRKDQLAFVDSFFTKPRIQQDINIQHLFTTWTLVEETYYEEDYRFIFTRLPKRQLGIEFKDQQVFIEKEDWTHEYFDEDSLSIKSTDFYKIPKSYDYSIQENRLIIDREDGAEEWEIIRLNKKEFWYRDVNAEDYRIYKCKKP